MDKTAIRTTRQLPNGGRSKTPDTLPRGPGLLTTTVDAYLLHLQVINRRPRTILDRGDNLRYFLQWANERDLIRPEQITRSILETYQRHLYHHRKKNDKPLGISTQRNRITIIKQYFAWLCRQRLLEANPAGELTLPRPQHRLPANPLAPSEINALLAHPDINDTLGLRDRAILELFYSTGIRRAELCNLQLSDLQRERAVLAIRQGKGSKDRVVPVGRRALLHLERYLDRTRPLLLRNFDQPTLFLSSYGQALKPDVLSAIVTRHLRTIGRAGGCHLLRHTCATHMLDGGADIRHVQELLGHAKLETTAIYTHVSIEVLKAVHARCHPAERPAASP